MCPHNSEASVTEQNDFAPRHNLDDSKLSTLFAWSESEFDQYTQGSAIRRLGHERWLRNIAVALGNAPTSPATIQALKSRLDHSSLLVREHVEWALEQHKTTSTT